MKLLPTRKPTTKEKIVAGAVAGLASSGAYAVMQAIDLVRPVGAVMHFGNGALLGVAYALVARDRLPGSPFVKGFTWTMIETFGLYPMAFLENLHPAIRDGRLPSYLSGKGFTQQILRHVAYGLVLGKVTERVLRR